MLGNLPQRQLYGSANEMALAAQRGAAEQINVNDPSVGERLICSRHKNVRN